VSKFHFIDIIEQEQMLNSIQY